MMTALPGVGGSLFPSRFLAAGLEGTAGISTIAQPDRPTRQKLLQYWNRVELMCGPATGLRTLFDVAAMPLVSLLGFRARDADFGRSSVRVRLRTRRGTHVGALVLPWATRPSGRWRDLVEDAHTTGATWCLIIAAPFVSVVDLRRQASRRSVDFRLPDALGDRSVAAFWTLCSASAFDPGVFEGRNDVTGIGLLASRAAAFQDLVRKDLQQGVVRAIAELGPALGHAGRAVTEDRFSEALTIVYRVLFLLFAEARDLVPHRHPAYGPAYAIGSLCRDAIRTPGHAAGLWEGLAAVTRLSRTGCESGDLIVKPFNGRLFARGAAPSLESSQGTKMATRTSRRRDAAMASVLAALGTRPGPAGREEISYSDLGVEQLGAVYERILDLDQDALSAPATTRHHSRRRKETGTFYTPQPLAEFVVRRTLAPMVRGATSDDILALRVVDPAMGSGAFLVAACRYLATAYEIALVAEGRCAETDLDANERARIRRTVAVHCLSGVDTNPTAVQLARLSLWLTTLARDKPLSFLDDRLRVGNSLLGCSPDDLWRAAFRRNDRRQPRSAPLLDAAGLEDAIRTIAKQLWQLREGRDDTVADVRAKERIWSGLTGDQSPIEPWRLACHVWCARWFWPTTDSLGPPSPAELNALMDALLRDDRTLGADRVKQRVASARASAHEHGFFHWPIEFADVFYADTGAVRDRAGFDAVIGNPPWEVLRRDGESGGAARDSPDHARTLAFLRQCGHFPSCDRGHVNLYQPFLDRSLSLARRGGRVGLVLPWGVAADEGAVALRARLINQGSVDAIVGFDNAEGIFPIHRGFRFMVLVASPGAPPREIRARFGVRTTDEIDDLPGEAEPGDDGAYPVRLTAATVKQVGGPALRIPDVRRAGDLDWLRRVSSAFPQLGARDGWAAEFGRELNATEDRASFSSAGLPVIDGKHIGPFTVDVNASDRRIPDLDARQRLPDHRFMKARLGYRDVSGPGNRYALIAAMIPANVVTTHTLFCLRNRFTTTQQYFLCGLFNSAPVNTIVRLLMGGHVTTGLVEGLPIPRWEGTPDQLRIAELAERLARNPTDDDALAELNESVAALYR